jgi:hypothetical protein
MVFPISPILLGVGQMAALGNLHCGIAILREWQQRADSDRCCAMHIST